ncbi:hypothetical protein DdX_21844 [Ditylenchus destructor]|uniref:Uncharacterized protein n=1 Tax=Ditylenchus destructor TaxID=166010 RepID=A0AAD4MJ03_9BILA|nr:hypothetical protein DdX_21844 [Ditylenchus destructor]
MLRGHEKNTGAEEKETAHPPVTVIRSQQQVLQKHFKDLMSNQTEVELNVVSVHSECFFPSVYQVKVTVRKGID